MKLSDWAKNKEYPREKLFQVGKGTYKGRFLSGFAYTLIKKKLESLAELKVLLFLK